MLKAGGSSNGRTFGFGPKNSGSSPGPPALCGCYAKMFITIEKASILKNDERGISYDFSARESGYFIFIHRKQGTISGNHYHIGQMASKSPEIIYLVTGSVTLTVRDIKADEEEVFDIEEGMKITIPPNIYHKFEAKTDIILMELLTDKKDFELYESDTVKK